MIFTPEVLLRDLAPFTDLGTGAPQIVRFQDSTICRLTRNGVSCEFVFYDAGNILERQEQIERRHQSLKALLASQTFANLGRWADSQKTLLEDRVKKESISLSGCFSSHDEIGGVDLLDAFLSFASNEPERTQPRVLVTLIDGPAGIDKTSLIRLLSFNRASSYRYIQRPLILHVESRGRVLQNLTDLMAFSLQTLRLSVTYDQVPVLIRHGLITLAVDGFDELGDPNGYELAWAQVNDLINSSRGAGVLVLSGRETFISRHRMELALSSLDRKLDKLETFTLNLLRPQVAKEWLLENRWTQDQIGSAAAEPLFEEGSYALRPFFLSELSRKGVAEKIQEGDIEDLLSFLVDAMVKREAEKFGTDIENVTTEAIRILFVRKLMEEIARDLAENQTGAISAESVAWLSEIVADQILPDGLVGIFKNRAGVIAFLTEDDRRGYKRFVHEQIQNYFLAQVTISSLIAGETPKYVRRNIFGPEFLENFCDVFRHSEQTIVDMLSVAVTRQIPLASTQDRSRRNLGALVFAMCSVAKPTTVPILTDLSLDEVYCSESVSRIKLERSSINQLYARSADMRTLEFSPDCFIISMIADDGTIPSESFPTPNILNVPGRTISAPEEKEAWLFQRTSPYDEDNDTDITAQLSSYTLFKLLARVARYKPFWLKDGDERAARRILDDPDWQLLKTILQKHGFVIERRDVQAAGRPGSFYHVKNKHKLLSFAELPISLFDDLLRESNVGGADWPALDV